jgi:hypothetical protein
MAFKKLRVWPMMGKPKEPGGSLLELLLVRRKYRGRRKRSKAKRISGFILLARNFGANCEYMKCVETNILATGNSDSYCSYCCPCRPVYISSIPVSFS